MGEVVPLRPAPADPEHEEWVRTLCFLAGHSERADDYHSRGTPRARIIADLRTLMFGRRSPIGNESYMAGLMGPAGQERRKRGRQP